MKKFTIVCLVLNILLMILLIQMTLFATSITSQDIYEIGPDSVIGENAVGESSSAVITPNDYVSDEKFTYVCANACVIECPYNITAGS